MRLYRWRRIPALLVVLLPGVVPLPGSAEEMEDVVRQLRDENAAMRRRLESQGERLRRLEQDQAFEGIDPGPADDAFSFSLSGFLKTDMLWNDTRVNSTNAPRFALPESGSDNAFTATVQHSRLILTLEGPRMGEGRLRGHVEADLFNLADFGDFNLQNNQFRMRQLFAAIDYPTWSVLVGQAWDLFSPLNVATLNTNGNYWFGGNAGFRRPQLQVRKRFDVADEVSLTVAASVNANVGVVVTSDGRILDVGRDAGVPVFEASLVSEFPGLPAGPVELGVWGLWGEEEFDEAGTRPDQWGVGGHLVLPLLRWARFTGEIHRGENLNAFLMGGGVNLTTGQAVGATSGWGQLSLGPWKKLTGNLMVGVDDPDDSDIVSGARSLNLVFGGNLRYRLYDHFVAGLEYQRFATEYLDAAKQEANVVWLSGILDF